MDITYIVTVVVVILVSMTLHELMHAVTAYWLGDQTPKAQGRISLNPVRHIDPFLTVVLPLMIIISNLATGSNMPIFGGAKPVQLNPLKIRHGDWGMALVALVGPLTNFMLAFTLFGVFVVSGVQAGSVYGNVLMTAVMVNLGFFVFNMIPVPPLDGSRVLYAFAPEVVRRGMQSIERSGLVVVFVLVLLGSGAIGTFMIAAIESIMKLFLFVYT